jgi:hypothetical protein
MTQKKSIKKVIKSDFPNDWRNYTIHITLDAETAIEAFHILEDSFNLCGLISGGSPYGDRNVGIGTPVETNFLEEE